MSALAEAVAFVQADHVYRIHVSARGVSGRFVVTAGEREIPTSVWPVVYAERGDHAFLWKADRSGPLVFALSGVGCLSAPRIQVTDVSVQAQEVRTWT